MLWRRVKSDIAQIWRKTWKNNFEGLNRTIQVHVKDGIVIVPHSGIWPCYLVTDEEDHHHYPDRAQPAVRGARSYPRLDRRLHSDGGTDSGKLKNVGPPVTEN